MKIAYTNLRVKNLDASLTFYQTILNMKQHHRIENTKYRYTLVWLGYESVNNKFAAGIELTYNWDQEAAYDIGNGFGQIVITVDDVYQTCAEIKAKNWPLTREAGPVKGGNTVIAFLNDPDGYRIELITKNEHGISF